MTRFARVGEGRKRPLEASQWKDLQKPQQKSSNSTSGPPSTNTIASTGNKTNTQGTSEPKDPVLEKTTNSEEPKTDGAQAKKKKKSGKKIKDYTSLECYNCHQKGHKVADCPAPSDGKKEEVECFKCNQKGHKAFKCPNGNKFTNPNKGVNSPNGNKFTNPNKAVNSQNGNKFTNPNTNFSHFKSEFRQQWNKKNGFSKAIRDGWKKHDKSDGKNYHQFKKLFVQEWNQKTGYNKALRDEWKVSGKELGIELKKQERSEERRQKRVEQRETDMQCFNCRGSGHMLSECPTLKKDVDQGTGICFKCGSTEHAVQKCTVRVPDGQYPYAKCFICGENGHISKQCPDNPRGLYPNGGCCNVCASVEHLKKDCPEMQKKQGIGSMTLTTLGASRSADWEDIKQYKPPQKIVNKGGPKLVKF